MKFQYYWDHGILDPSFTDDGGEMGTPADIQRLMERIKRAQGLTDRAATHGENADKIMDNFEKTMANSESHFGNIAEYDKQLAAMLAVGGNGGPPLEETFQPSGSVVTPSQPSPAVDRATGDPLKT